MLDHLPVAICAALLAFPVILFIVAGVYAMLGDLSDWDDPNA